MVNWCEEADFRRFEGISARNVYIKEEYSILERSRWRTGYCGVKVGERRCFCSVSGGWRGGVAGNARRWFCGKEG